MKVLLVTVLLIFSSFYLHAQTAIDQKEMQKQIEEIMKNREEIFRSLLNDDSFKDMEKRMQEMMKNFGGDDFNFDSESLFGGAIVGEYDWIEDDKYRILKLKVTQIKDRPLDIKIEKGQIKLKGDVESVSNDKKKGSKKTKTKVHFERVFSIPEDVDDKNPEFDNKEGELLIKFKKLGKSTEKLNKNTNNIKSKKGASENNEDRRPISPDDKDITF